jgi:hypothetical protein
MTLETDIMVRRSRCTGLHHGEDGRETPVSLLSLTTQAPDWTLPRDATNYPTPTPSVAFVVSLVEQILWVMDSRDD